MSKPNVLIFGGLATFTPALTHYLVPSSGEALVGSIKIYDKYSVNPPTTYLGEPFKKLLADRTNIIEYQQVNLTVPSVVTNCFASAPKNGGKWNYIFDLTGDINYDRPAAIQITHTLKVSHSIAKAAASKSHDSLELKAYIRFIHPVYDHSSNSEKAYTESEEKGWKPLGVRGVWWHETVRALGTVEGLPLVVLRTGYAYGPNFISGEIPTLILCGYAYKQLGEKMQYLWGSKLKKSTVHTQDVAGAAWASAQWIEKVGHTAALAQAGVDLKATKDAPSQADDAEDAQIKAELETRKGDVKVIAFNVVDDSDTSQDTLGSTISKVFGIEFGFHGIMHSQLAQFKMADVAEDINDMHMEGWGLILNASDPPVPNTPLSPYAQPHQLEKHGFGGEGSKLKQVVGYTLQKPQFTPETVKEIIQSWREEGTWPETALYQG